MQFIAFGAGMIGKFTPLPVLPEDVGALVLHSPPIAHAAANCAAEHETFGFWFDKITAMGPFGELFEAVLACGLQVAANHNKGVRDGTLDPAQFGAVHPSQLAEMVTSNGEQPETEAA
jgi:hypothetical protein